MALTWHGCSIAIVLVMEVSSRLPVHADVFACVAAVPVFPGMPDTAWYASSTVPVCGRS